MGIAGANDPRDFQEVLRRGCVHLFQRDLAMEDRHLQHHHRAFALPAHLRDLQFQKAS